MSAERNLIETPAIVHGFRPETDFFWRISGKSVLSGTCGIYIIWGNSEAVELLLSHTMEWAVLSVSFHMHLFSTTELPSKASVGKSHNNVIMLLI